MSSDHPHSSLIVTELKELLALYAQVPAKVEAILEAFAGSEKRSEVIVALRSDPEMGILDQSGNVADLWCQTVERMIARFNAPPPMPFVPDAPQEEPVLAD